MLGTEYAEWAAPLDSTTARRYDCEALGDTMKQGQLVRIHHIGPHNGVDPCGQVPETVGKVGVVSKRDDDGRWEIIVPPYGPYIYSAKEVEPIKGLCEPCQGWGRWGTDITCDVCGGTGEAAGVG